MKLIAKNIIYLGVLLILLPLLFFSCSASKKSVSSASGKHAPPFDEDKFKSLYYDGMMQQIQGDYDEALSSFKQCLALNPASAAANFEMSEIYEYDKRPDSSLFFISRAVNDDPDNIWYKYFYAQNLQELGRYKEEIKVYEALVKAHPETTDLYYKLALAQLQAQEYKEAIETYNTLEKMEGGVDEDIAMSKIEILEKIKDYAGAEDEINKLINYDPTVPQYYDMLGNLYELEGKDDKAFAEYQKMEEMYPHDPMVHLSLADYYKTKNQDVKAYEELEKAFDEPSLDVDTKIRIIMGLSTFTNADTIANEALTLSRKMVESNPTEPKAHVLYAEVLLQNAKNVKEARDQYRIAVSEDSNRYEYWNKLLQLEARLNDFKDMQAESREAISLFPSTAQFYYLNGFANMQLKDFDDALTAFKSGIFYVTNDSNLLGEFYANIGDAGYYTRRFGLSDSAYEQALKINPNNDYVLNNYSYYLSVRDTNLARAEEMSEKANKLDTASDAYEDTYAWILYMMGKYPEAKQWENKAIMNGGDKDVTILEHYGNILFKLGEKDSALEYWTKAKEGGANSELLDREIKDKQLYEK